MKQQKNGAQRVKVITLGDVKVGKSCLVKKYCDPNHFVSNYVPTIGVDYGVKTIAHKGNGADGSSLDGRMKIKVDFFDLSGDPDYNEVRNEFYANADGVLIIFDVTRKESFASLDGWLKEVAKYGLSSQSGTLAVVANKVDQYPRVVTEQEGTSFAMINDAAYFETSAKTGSNVGDMFDYLIQNARKKKSGQ